MSFIVRGIIIGSIINLRVVSCEITKRMEVDFEESHDVYLPNKK